jgi:hypothetical protein
MTDDQIVQLLREIRDLQQQHLEHYKEALRNQQESIGMQREWQESASRRLRVIIAVVVLFVLAMWVLPYLGRL